MRSEKSILLRVCLALAVGVLLFASSRPAQAQSNVTLLLHDVIVQPMAGTATHDVSIYFSLLDSGGNPVKDAGMGDFTLLEDGQPVQIASLARADDEPISVALLLDTSGSMTSDKMDAARRAASRFISDLQGGDRVAVLTFDTTIVPQIDFTGDHTAARQRVELVQSTPGGGTCLYDALYQTVQMTTPEPAGRRAIIVLTDGVDEAGGRPCSYYTVEDVIALANQAETRTPIYTIGLGNNVDAQTLDRIARQTSGHSLYAATPTQLDALFGRLTDELRSQYVLHYTSAATGGKHTLTLQVRRNGARDQADLEVEFPALPYHIAFTSPTQAAEVSGPMTVAVTISGQGTPIQRVQFLANGVSIGADNEAPYELEWDPSSLQPGEIFIEAVAQDAAGNELARGGVTVTYRPVVPTPAGGSTPQVSSSRSIVLIVAILGGLILFGALVAILLVAAKKRKREQQREEEWKRTVQGIGVSPTGGMEDRTLDAFAPSENALAVLVILNSDDPAMIHQRFEITKPVTHLGRKADNDVIFAKDSTVSRHHAIIEERNGQMFLSEVMGLDDYGRPKPPTYGTFVNGTQIREVHALHDGDEIQLGKRVRLRFEALLPTSGAEERTLDQLSPDDDKTTDFNVQ